MDNLTHSLVGLAASKAGLERLSPGTTASCILAANAPDSDIASLLIGGRWAFLQYHRGITHSILGTLVLALLIPLVFYAADLFTARIRARARAIKLRRLILASLIVSATHPLMDWTNNYGVRLLLPWSAKWFYGDLVFIVDPFLWLIIGGAAFLLTSETKKQIGLWAVLGLLLTYVVMFGTGNRPGLTHLALVRGFWAAALVALLLLFKLRAAQRWGERVAITGFAVVLLYWGGLAFLHTFALTKSRIEASLIASEHGENVLEVAAMPMVANPFYWQCVVETERAGYRFEWSLLSNSRSNLVRYEKPNQSILRVVAEASNDARARIFLGFARFPVARVIDADCATQTLVQFADLRYTEPGAQRGTFALEVPVECQPERAEKMGR